MLLSEELVSKSALVLNVSASPIDEVEVQNSFLELLSDTSSDRDQQLVEAKNILLARVIETQLKTDRRYRLNILGYNKCDPCFGYGFHPIFVIETITEKCRSCGGSGIKTSRCLRCKGTGVLPEEHDPQCEKNYNRICTLCDGTKKYVYRKGSKRKEIVKCIKCSGSGDKKQNIKLGRIETIYICTHCKGVGRNTHNSVCTPLIPDSIGCQLKRLFSDK